MVSEAADARHRGFKISTILQEVNKYWIADIKQVYWVSSMYI